MVAGLRGGAASPSWWRVCGEEAATNIQHQRTRTQPRGPTATTALGWVPLGGLGFSHDQLGCTRTRPGKLAAVYVIYCVLQMHVFWVLMLQMHGFWVLSLTQGLGLGPWVLGFKLY